MSTGTESLLPRLLRGVGAHPIIELAEHLDLHGALAQSPERRGASLIDELELAGLRGHGGAAFPTARKWRTVASRRGPRTVVVNGTEGEPASKKDRALLREAPHLVLDGAALAARAIDARDVYIAVSEADPRSRISLTAALEQRRAVFGEPRFQLFIAPDRFLAGQETALVSMINGGPCLPRFEARPYERGVRQRPTLVQNAETLAHVALIARHGAAWFRRLGTDRDPGSALVTVSGAVAAPGVHEIAHGTSLAQLLELAGVRARPAAVLIGGYFGTWLPGDGIGSVKLSASELRDHGASLGAGVIVALGGSACPVAEVARVSGWFAKQSAGQCGPCVYGLEAIAATVQSLAMGRAAHTALRDLTRWAGELPGRGACRHPDGAARFIAGALDVFAEEFRGHAVHGPCQRCTAAPLLPVPAMPAPAAA